MWMVHHGRLAERSIALVSKARDLIGSEVQILYRPLRVHGWTARLLLSEIYLG